MQLSITSYADRPHRQQVSDLWTAVFGPRTGHNEPGLSIDRKLAVADGLFFVALDKDHVVGTVMAGYDGHRGWLYSVAVQPERQRAGIGAALVRHAERALLARGCLKINLQVTGSNAAVVPFYTALGYHVEDRISLGRIV